MRNIFTTSAGTSSYVLTQPVQTSVETIVTLNGLVLEPPVDYSIAGNIITLSTAPMAGMTLAIIYTPLSVATSSIATPIISSYDTAANIVIQAAAEIGLQVTTATIPYTSNDPAIQRIIFLLNSCGRELRNMYEWQSKLAVYNLTTQVGDTGVYSLPTDFDVFIDQTGWQKSYFWPMRGPYSAQMWQRVVNYPTTGIYVAFRIQDNQLWLWPQPPPANIGITFMYKTLGWVSDANTQVLKDHVDAGADIVLFDKDLASALLKLRYLETIGHDTTAAEKRFNRFFDQCTSKDAAAAPELQLAKDTRYPFITGFNAPDTGFGGQPPQSGSYQ